MLNYCINGNDNKRVFLRVGHNGNLLYPPPPALHLYPGGQIHGKIHAKFVEDLKILPTQFSKRLRIKMLALFFTIDPSVKNHKITHLCPLAAKVTV